MTDRGEIAPDFHSAASQEAISLYQQLSVYLNTFPKAGEALLGRKLFHECKALQVWQLKRMRENLFPRDLMEHKSLPLCTLLLSWATESRAVCSRSRLGLL